MRPLGNAGIKTWAVLTIGFLVGPGTAFAQFGGLGGGLGSALFGGGGGMGMGGMGNSGGMGMGGIGSSSGMGMGGGLSGLGGLLGGGGMNSNPWRNGSMGSGYNQPGYNNSLNPGYYNTNTNSGYYNQPNQGYPNTVQQPPPAPSSGQPYRAVDGKWYYPDGRPYVAPAAPARRATTTAATPPREPAPTPAATPTANFIPDYADSASTATNIVRTQLPAVSPTVHEDLSQRLTRSLEEGIERMENSLRDVLFTNADETSFLAIYKRAFTEDTSQFRLARKNIKYRDADELRQGLVIDGIVDAGAQLFPAKLEVSAVLDTFKRSVLDGRPAVEIDRATKGLLKTFESLSRSTDFDGMNLPDLDQIRSDVSTLKQVLEVHTRLAEPRTPTAGGDDHDG